jgi:hypothetical protein
MLLGAGTSGNVENDDKKHLVQRKYKKCIDQYADKRDVFNSSATQKLIVAITITLSQGCWLLLHSPC